MAYEEVVSRFGKIGRYQRRVFAILCIPMISCAFLKMGGVFLSARTDFRCLLPTESPENATYQIISINFTNTTNQWVNGTVNWPKCEKYEPGITEPYNNTKTVKCDSFLYDKTHYSSTSTIEWNLVCDKAWLKSLSDSLFMLGDLPGVVIWGALSDKYGRRTILLWGSLMQSVCALLLAFSPNITTFMICRTLLGSTISGLISVSMIHVVEMVSHEDRIKFTVILKSVFAMGCIVTPGIAYFIRNWRSLQITYAVPSLILHVLCWSTPESVRWLLSKGRVQKAKDVLEKACSENGTKISQNTLNELFEDECQGKSIIEQASPIDLLRYPNLRKRCLLQCVIWFIISLTYYGLSLNTSNFGGNDYVNFLILAAVEIPAYGSLLFTLDRWGRRTVSCGYLLFAGSSMLLIVTVPPGMTWPLKLLATIGKFAITSAWATCWIFTAELYPTALRNVGLASCSAFARIAGALAPFIDHLFQISKSLPLVVLGCCAIIGGLLSLLLPETLNQKLPEIIEDAEKIGQKASDLERDIERSNDADSMKPLKENGNEARKENEK